MKYVIGNWKMSPPSWGEAKAILSRLAQELPSSKNVTTVVCPPFIYLHPVSSLTPGSAAFMLGAQDVHYERKGSHTGEISVEQLTSLGVSHVIVGHSERRALGETNDIVAKKVQTVIAAGLTAVLCVGEAEREGDWHAFVIQEVEAALALLNAASVKQLVIAYEPIWAIGAQEADTPDSAQTSALLIRKVVQKYFGEDAGEHIPVIYGGSVNAKNVRGFASIEGIDGVLPGRASRDAAEFSEIIKVFIESA